MFRTCLENRVVQTKDGYECWLCDAAIPDDEEGKIYEHIVSKTHKFNTTQIDETVREDELRKLSNIPASQQIKIFENQITLDKKPYSFHCHVCKCSMPSITNTLNHIKGRSHQRKLNQNQPKKSAVENSTESDVDTTSHEPEVIPKQPAPSGKLPDCITHLANNSYRCTVCNCDIHGNLNIHQHVRGNVHQENLKLDQSKKVQKKAPDAQSKSKEKPRKSAYDSILREIRHCDPCQSYFRGSLMLQCHIMWHLYEEHDFPILTDIISFKSYDPGQLTAECLLCKTASLSSHELFEHIKSGIHLNRIEFFNSIKTDFILDSEFIRIDIDREKLKKSKFKPQEQISNGYLCGVCDVPIPDNSKKKVELHVEGKKHSNNVMIRKRKNCTESAPKFLPNFSNLYCCFMCQLAFPELRHLINHYNEIQHKYRIENFIRFYESQFTDFIYANQHLVICCNICNDIMINFGSAVEHLLTMNHSPNQRINLNPSTPGNFPQHSQISVNEVAYGKRNDPNEFYTCPEELIALGFSVESAFQDDQTLPASSSSEVDGLLNNLIHLNLDKTQQKNSLSSIKEKTSVIQSNETFLIENVAYFGMSLVDYCINQGEKNIYNHVKERMRLIRLGSTLTIPMGPERLCIPCIKKFPSDEQSILKHLEEQTHIYKLMQMEVSDQVSEIYVREFSDLKLAKEYMKVLTNEWLFCYACDSKVENADYNIYVHSKSSEHIQKVQAMLKDTKNVCQGFLNILKDVWYYSQVLACDLCHEKFNQELEFIIHLERPSHANKLKILQAFGSEVKFYICPACTLYWIGDANSYNTHFESHLHKAALRNNNSKVPDLNDDTLRLLTNFEDVINFLISESDKVALECNKEFKLLRSIEEIVRCLYPHANAYLSGERLSRLAATDEETSVFLDCENQYRNRSTQEKSQQYLMDIEKFFKAEPKIWRVSETPSQAENSILNLLHIPSGMRCNIFCTNGLNVEKSKLLKYYSNVPECRKMILFLRKWLSVCNLSGTELISNYAISWFVIFYLQVKGGLPSVHDLIEQKVQSNFVDGWDCGFFDATPASCTKQLLKNYLQGFFSFYASFDYQSSVICPYLGKVVKKSSFAYIHELSPEMKLYMLRATSDRLLTFRIDSPLCIQDPIELSQNLTKSITKYRLRCFRHFCSVSSKRLTGNRNK
ncbi:hypothetical protein QAD02_011244 [Eretmocerus hayati]|uniref:Uncharacterized protein n=1 Tax=Eretmocerus hayati TaxID=131215 RepID=A0ACC2NW68_9HYME|nr:hypothetical protein QAD02_011244 [Eretmocerus hayati]